MQFSGHKRQLLTYGLICAGAVGVFGTALADDHMQDKETKAERISEDVNTFNENRGSLKEDSAARSGAVTGELNGSADASAAMHGDHERADELSEEVKDYNQSGGSLNSDSSASTDLDDNTHASGDASNGASAESQELSNEVEEYNKNAE